MQRELELIRAALEEHLSAINDNGSEIQALFDYLHQLEVKFDKLSQRMDHMQLDGACAPAKHQVASLNHIEKKIFLVLYTEDTPLSFKEISLKTDLPESLVPDCISTLVSKGIPLRRSYFNDQLFFALDPQFKECQAKENLVNLSLQSFM